MADKRSVARSEEFSAAEIGALAHLYRGEVYRSTVWRTTSAPEPITTTTRSASGAP